MGVVGGATVVGGARARKVALDLADSRFNLFRMMMKRNDHDEDTGETIFFAQAEAHKQVGFFLKCLTFQRRCYKAHFMLES